MLRGEDTSAHSASPKQTQITASVNWYSPEIGSGEEMWRSSGKSMAFGDYALL
jgi:hypothetical protein